MQYFAEPGHPGGRPARVDDGAGSARGGVGDVRRQRAGAAARRATGAREGRASRAAAPVRRASPRRRQPVPGGGLLRRAAHRGGRLHQHQR